MATYGPSANGIEGDPARINVMNVNWFTTLSTRMVNEAHFTYSRESRPRTAAGSGLAADTGIGFSPSFRFGDPFFLQPNVDELIWRTQFKDNISLVTGSAHLQGRRRVDAHAERSGLSRVLHGTVSVQQRRGLSALCVTGCAWRIRAEHRQLLDACVRDDVCDRPGGVPGGLLRRTAGRCSSICRVRAAPGPRPTPRGHRQINNNEFSLFAQDSWQIRPNITLNYGLRWDAQTMPETVDPRTTAYAAFLTDPTFPSDGTIPSQWAMFQPRVGVAWDVKGDGTSLVRSSWGVYYARQNMLSQVGSVTTNGLQQQTIFLNTQHHQQRSSRPVWPGVVSPAPLPEGQFPLFSGVRVFDRDYKNPHVFAFNVAYEQQLAPDWAGYVDFIWNEGNDLTRFLNYNRSGPVCCADGPGTGQQPSPIPARPGDLSSARSWSRTASGRRDIVG